MHFVDSPMNSSLPQQSLGRAIISGHLRASNPSILHALLKALNLEPEHVTTLIESGKFEDCEGSAEERVDRAILLLFPLCFDRSRIEYSGKINIALKFGGKSAYKIECDENLCSEKTPQTKTLPNKYVQVDTDFQTFRSVLRGYALGLDQREGAPLKVREPQICEANSFVELDEEAYQAVSGGYCGTDLSFDSGLPNDIFCPNDFFSDCMNYGCASDQGCGGFGCGNDTCGGYVCGADACGNDIGGAEACAAAICGADACGVDVCGADACGANVCAADAAIIDTCSVNACVADVVPFVPGV